MNWMKLKWRIRSVPLYLKLTHFENFRYVLWKEELGKAIPLSFMEYLNSVHVQIETRHLERSRTAAMRAAESVCEDPETVKEHLNYVMQPILTAYVDQVWHFGPFRSKPVTRLAVRKFSSNWWHFFNTSGRGSRGLIPTPGEAIEKLEYRASSSMNSASVQVLMELERSLKNR